jgi:hypothetical protein
MEIATCIFMSSRAMPHRGNLLAWFSPMVILENIINFGEISWMEKFVTI